ncbi:hypothetical protein Terro_3420 [Terriglobus roseus DSM 18391]|uniref:Uncharacterized protein n=1 Tax=Terriglobus roseus (strain DSM 18391 / NRRL B-41598 / KBS 63) TaxID=926566 RepID=I3ZK67_TERRK|nr:hypothetical protein [Terriglobus roseus]AFL89635.1 hypothetical protein Terro_3420 [Terriglobus roseus DSM 18391]
MTVEDKIHAHAEEIEHLRVKSGALSISAYVRNVKDQVEPVFVVDFDTSKLSGYSDRYFEMMFGLQRIFLRPVDLWEKHMFEEQSRMHDLRQVSLSVFRATA